MALIRHAQAEKIARDALVLDLGDVRAQAELIIAQARSRASEMILDARAERERIIAGAYEEGQRAGFEAGHAQGLAQGTELGRAEALASRTAEIEQVENAWSAALASFNAQRDALLDDARDSVLTLACRIASRVTQRVVTSDPEVVVDQVRESISMVTGASRVLIEISPGCEQLVRGALPKVMAALGSSAHTEVRTDQSLSPGSCVVRTAGGQIDASIQTQLSRIAEALVPGAGGQDMEAHP